jgi:uncharacterized protein YxeA
MKKIFTVVMAVAFAFSVAGFALAMSHEKAAPAAEKSATEAKKPAKMAKTQKVTGTIEAVDAAAGTFTVKGKKGNVDLKAGEKVKLGDFKVGDKVVVRYADGAASSVKAVKASKAAKKAAPKVESAPTTTDPSPASGVAPPEKTAPKAP